MKSKFVRFVSFFAIVSMVLVLNICGISQDNTATEYYNQYISLSESFNPNISLRSVNADVPIDITTTSGKIIRAYKRGEIPNSEYNAWINYVIVNFPPNS